MGGRRGADREENPFTKDTQSAGHLSNEDSA